MRNGTYVNYEDLKGNEYIITYQCFVDTINNPKTDNYMDVTFNDFDKIFNIETSTYNFNVIVPVCEFDFEDYKTSDIRIKEEL